MQSLGLGADNERSAGLWQETRKYTSKLIINCTLTYLVTYSMAQSPTWEATWFLASQEIPHSL
jgi:hypothetical protein